MKIKPLIIKSIKAEKIAEKIARKEMCFSIKLKKRQQISSEFNEIYENKNSGEFQIKNFGKIFANFFQKTSAFFEINSFGISFVLVVTEENIFIFL